MKLVRVAHFAPVFYLASALVASAVAAQGTTPNPAPAHRMMAADEVVWGPTPPGLPSGSKMTVLSGDPGQPGPFTARAQLPAGYRIPPHWHSTEENLTVLSGVLGMGMGDKFDEPSLREIRTGGFVHMAPNTRHFLLAKADTVIQVHGVGPFSITYVNPADDPRNVAPKK
jgi:quercetin dioxygenase-like cupin family protein